MNSTSPLLLDTCALIWLVGGEPISSQFEMRLKNTRHDGAIRVHPMSAWEVGMLVAKNRLSLSMPVTLWFERAMHSPLLRWAEMEPEALIESTNLPGEPPSDPVDRIMIASARKLGAELVTRDSKILGYGQMGYVNTLEC